MSTDPYVELRQDGNSFIVRSKSDKRVTVTLMIDGKQTQVNIEPAQTLDITVHSALYTPR